MTYHLLNHQLKALLPLLYRIGEADYTLRSAMLGEATIGQHIRHIIELVQCLVNGYDNGTVNYDARIRDIRIETDKHFAGWCIRQLLESTAQADKPLQLITSGEPAVHISTFYYRELLYNTEHAIHHMALIRVGLREMHLDIVDDHFGVAPSTVQYREKVCAQ